MTQKEIIIHKLQEKSVMTQDVKRSGSRPSFYSPTDTNTAITEKEQATAKAIIPLTNDSLNEAAKAISNDPTYIQEEQLLKDTLACFPENEDRLIVAMKIGLIDITNSTHISQHKSKVNVVELLDIIMGIENLDGRIKAGDESLVSEIAQKTKLLNNNSGANFFSHTRPNAIWKRTGVLQS